MVSKAKNVSTKPAVKTVKKVVASKGAEIKNDASKLPGVKKDSKKQPATASETDIKDRKSDVAPQRANKTNKETEHSTADQSKPEAEGATVEVKNIKDEPAQVNDEPAQVKDEPAQVNDEQAEVNDEPAEVNDELSEVKDEPAEVNDEPSEVKDETAKVNDEPAQVKDEPSQVNVTEASEPMEVGCSAEVKEENFTETKPSERDPPTSETPIDTPQIPQTSQNTPQTSIKASSGLGAAVHRPQINTEQVSTGFKQAMPRKKSKGTIPEKCHTFSSSFPLKFYKFIIHL